MRRLPGHNILHFPTSDRFRAALLDISSITVSLCVALICQGCFTGIEGTRKITISREEKKMLHPTPEQRVMQNIKGENVASWLPGKQFAVADERIDNILIPANSTAQSSVNKGDTLIFSQLISTTGFDGNDEYHIIFKHRKNDNTAISSDERLDYSTRLSGLNGQEDIVSDRLPMLIDLDMVRRADSLLNGKRVYLLSPRWLDSLGNRKTGPKYIEAIISGVRPGTLTHPMMVDFYAPSLGDTGTYMMNFDSGERGTRGFSTLFSLDNPHKSYSSIPDDIWQQICNGSVSTGMNKNECRLAIGSPDDVTATRDYSSTIDIWRYADGSVLFFRDGLLSEYKVGTETHK